MEITEQQIKEELKKDLREKFLENVKEGEINWVDGDNWNWDYCKGYSKKLFGHKKKYVEHRIKWFFLAHSNDEIVGKPQLIQNTLVKLPLVRQAINKMKDLKTKKDIEIQSFYFFDEKFDRRHDGFQKDAFALDFYKYQVITRDDREVYLFS